VLPKPRSTASNSTEKADGIWFRLPEHFLRLFVEHAAAFAAERTAPGLNKLRKNTRGWVRLAESKPQGLKPTSI
jgi:hypothetical protein